MYRLIFSGWKNNIKKVSLTRLLKEKANLSLSSSKRIVDGLLLGEEFCIQMQNEALINELKNQAIKLGAICKIEEIIHTNKVIVTSYESQLSSFL